MDNHVFAPGYWKPSPEQMIIGTVKLSHTSLKCFCKKASSMGFGSANFCADCVRYKPLALCNTVRGKDLVLFVDQPCHAGKRIPHLMKR